MKFDYGKVIKKYLNYVSDFLKKVKLIFFIMIID